MMKALEKELNVKLFTKKNQEMVLSEAGIHFYKYAKAILTSCSKLEDKVKELRTTPGESLIVATTSSIAESFMPELMHIFHKRKDMKDTEVILKLAPSRDAVLDMLKNGEVELEPLFEYDGKEDRLCQKGAGAPAGSG